MGLNKNISTLFIAAVVFSGAAHGATFVVNDPSDAVDANTSDNACATDAGACTLRAAVMQANATAGADIIEIQPGEYALTIPRDPTIPPFQDSAATGDLDIIQSVTIRGLGGTRAEVVIFGGGFSGTLKDRVFQVRRPGGPAAALEVTFENLSITGGYQGDSQSASSEEAFGGGGIYVYAAPSGTTSTASGTSVTVRNVDLSGNYSFFGGGGLTNSGGQVLIEDSVLNENRTPYRRNNTSGFQGGGSDQGAFFGGGFGGGVANWGGRLTIRNSVVSANQAQTGGAIFNQDAGVEPAVVLVEDSSLTANLGFMGAGIFNSGQGSWNYTAGLLEGAAVRLVRTTVQGNRAEFAGGGIFNVGTIRLANSTLSANEAADDPGNPKYPGRGGGIYTSGRVVIIDNSTIAGNWAEEDRLQAGTATDSLGGDEIFFDYLTATNTANNTFRFTMQNSILGDGDQGAGDVSPGTDNCNGPAGYEQYISSLGNNVDAGGSTCLGGTTVQASHGDLLNVTAAELALDPLAPNPAFNSLPNETRVETRALGEASVAVNAGANCPGSDGRSYGRSDGNCDIGAFEFNAASTGPLNVAPVPAEDAVSTNMNDPVELEARFLLANDADFDGDELQLESVTVADGEGTVTAIPDAAAYRYVPPPDVAGQFQLSYTVSDGTDVVTGTVTVHVYDPADAATNNPPQAVADAMTVGQQDGGGGAEYMVDVLSNDSDPDAGDTVVLLDVTASTLNTGGAVSNVTINQDKVSVTYTPPVGATGVDTFTYTIIDNRDDSASPSRPVEGTVTVTINAAPVVQSPAAVSVDPGTSASVTLAITDDEGDAYVTSVTGEPTQGVVTPSPDTVGSFTYVANADAAGADEFTVTVDDGFNRVDVTVPVAINAAGGGTGNNPPAVTDSTLTVAPGATETGTFQATDSDGDTLTFAIVTQPQQGTLTLDDAATGAFTYVASDTATGTDTVEFSVNDGTVTEAGVLTISITTAEPGANNPPRATAAQFQVPAGAEIFRQVFGSDQDSDPLTYALVDSPQQGTVNFQPDGRFSYQANADASGTDSFTFVADDGTDQSEPATVSITILPPQSGGGGGSPPPGGGGGAPGEVTPPSVPSNTTLQLDLGAQLTLEGQLSVDNVSPGDSVTYVIVEQPEEGSVTVNPSTGDFTYTPAVSASASLVSFTYRVDLAAAAGTVSSNVGTVRISISAGGDSPGSDPATGRGDSGANDDDSGGGALGFWLLAGMAGVGIVRRRGSHRRA